MPVYGYAEAYELKDFFFVLVSDKSKTLGNDQTDYILGLRRISLPYEVPYCQIDRSLGQVVYFTPEERLRITWLRFMPLGAIIYMLYRYFSARSVWRESDIEEKLKKYKDLPY